MRNLLFLAMLVGCSCLSLFALDSIKLSNGASLDWEKDAGALRQNVVFILHEGPAQVPADRQGTSALIAQILDEGPTGMSLTDYRRELFMNTASISYGPIGQAFYISVSAPPEQMPATLALVKKTLDNPKMDEATHQEALQKLTNDVQARFQNMQAAIFHYASRVASNNHPSILSGAASPSTLPNLTRKNTLAFYPKIVNLQKANVFSVGPMPGPNLAALINQSLLKDAGKHQAYKPLLLDAEKLQQDKLKIHLIEKSGVADNQVLFSFPQAFEYDKKDQVIADVTRRILGGGSTGRLYELRAKRGLTYFAGIVPMGRLWSVWTFGGHEQVGKLIQGVPEIINDFKGETITQDDLDLSVKLITNNFRQGRELSRDRMTRLIQLKAQGRDITFDDQYLKLLNQVTLEEVRAFADNRIHWEKGRLFLMGDKTVLMNALKEAGYDESQIELVQTQAL